MTCAPEQTEPQSQLHTGHRKQRPSSHLGRRHRTVICRWHHRETTSHHPPTDTRSQHRDVRLSSANENSLHHTQSSRLATLTHPRVQRTTHFPCATKQLFHMTILTTSRGTGYNNRKHTLRWLGTRNRNRRSSCPATTTTSKARHGSAAICPSNLLRS
jgi:hypothetical protein